ncbi:MAG: hypothetical protein LBD59_10730 [Prevotellaceae bacterium]|jgi:hypothetical protein|nr:hypothetical protein [Prevotellaceae bacterium]
MTNTILENEELSANTLFNFTKKREYLLLNLEKNFRPRLVLEEYKPILGKEYKAAVPMTCFCDIRLSNISVHIKEYGNYGIGLKKKWGISKGLNPVQYISSKDSYFLTSFRKMTDDLKPDTNSFMNVFVFFKPYKGEQNGKNRNFYNEREWRYVPSEIDVDKMMLTGEEYEDTLKQNNINEILQQPEYTLAFLFSDIKYIVIDKDNDKDVIIETMLKTPSVTEKEISHIIFITNEMIKNDI